LDLRHAKVRGVKNGTLTAARDLVLQQGEKVDLPDNITANSGPLLALIRANDAPVALLTMTDQAPVRVPLGARGPNVLVGPSMGTTASIADNARGDVSLVNGASLDVVEHVSPQVSFHTDGRSIWVNSVSGNDVVRIDGSGHVTKFNKGAT